MRACMRRCFPEQRQQASPLIVVSIAPPLLCLHCMAAAAPSSPPPFSIACIRSLLAFELCARLPVLAGCLVSQAHSHTRAPTHRRLLHAPRMEIRKRRAQAPRHKHNNSVGVAQRSVSASSLVARRRAPGKNHPQRRPFHCSCWLLLHISPARPQPQQLLLLGLLAHGPAWIMGMPL